MPKIVKTNLSTTKLMEKQNVVVLSTHCVECDSTSSQQTCGAVDRRFCSDLRFSTGCSITGCSST